MKYLLVFVVGFVFIPLPVPGSKKEPIFIEYHHDYCASDDIGVVRLTESDVISKLERKR